MQSNTTKSPKRPSPKSPAPRASVAPAAPPKTYTKAEREKAFEEAWAAGVAADKPITVKASEIGVGEADAVFNLLDEVRISLSIASDLRDLPGQMGEFLVSIENRVRLVTRLYTEAKARAEVTP